MLSSSIYHHVIARASSSSTEEARLSRRNNRANSMDVDPLLLHSRSSNTFVDERNERGLLCQSRINLKSRLIRGPLIRSLDRLRSSGFALLPPFRPPLSLPPPRASSFQTRAKLNIYSIRYQRFHSSIC